MIINIPTMKKATKRVLRTQTWYNFAHRVEKTHIYVFCLFRFLIMYVTHDCWQQTLLSIVKGVWMLFNHKLMVVYRNNGLLQLLSVSTGWTLQFSSSTTGSNSTWELPMSKLICTERLIAENSVCGFPLAFLCSFHQLLIQLTWSVKLCRHRHGPSLNGYHHQKKLKQWTSTGLLEFLSGEFLS